MSGTLESVAEKVWTAEELEQMSPADRHALFQASIVRDLDQVPADFLETIRHGLHERITGEEAQQ